MRKFLLLSMVVLLISGCSSQPEIATEGPPLKASLEQTWQLGDGAGRQAAFSPDGALLALAAATGEVTVRRSSDWTLVTRLRHDGGATAVAFAPGNHLLTAGYDGLVRTWDLGSTHEVNRYAGAQGTLWSIDVSPDGKRVAAAGEDQIIRIWPLDSDAEPLMLKGHQRNVWNMRFSPDGKRLASGSFDQTARIWDASTGKTLRTLKGHDQAVVGLDLSDDGKLLVTGGDDSTVRLWRTADGAQLKRVEAGNHVYATDLSADGRWLVTGGRARGAIGTFWHQLTGAGGDTMPARLWRTSDMALVAALPHPEDVMDVAFSPDGRWLVTSSEDHKARLWRLTIEPR